MVKKILLCRDWTFFSFIFWYGSCYLSRRDDFNDVWNLLYGLNEVKVFLIFHVEMTNQKVVRLTTWVVESKSCLDFYKIWLKRSQRTKFQVD